MHRQIKIVGILLIVQGSLELVMGGFYCLMGPLMMGIMASAPPPSSGGAPPPPELFAGLYIAMGLPTAIAGIVKIVSGIYNVRLKGRVLGYIALGSGLVSSVSCYCLPTALGLGIYGLIVYLNQKSGEAFAMVQNGMPADQALATIDGLVPMGGMYPGGPPGPPPPPPYPGY